MPSHFVVEPLDPESRLHRKAIRNWSNKRHTATAITPLDTQTFSHIYEALEPVAEKAQSTGLKLYLVETGDPLALPAAVQHAIFIPRPFLERYCQPTIGTQGKASIDPRGLWVLAHEMAHTKEDFRWPAMISTVALGALLGHGASELAARENAPLQDNLAGQIGIFSLVELATTGIGAHLLYRQIERRADDLATTWTGKPQSGIDFFTDYIRLECEVMGDLALYKQPEWVRSIVRMATLDAHDPIPDRVARLWDKSMEMEACALEAQRAR